MDWILLGIAILLSVPLGLGLLLLVLEVYVYVRYVDNLARIFLEKPLFIIPRGQPIDGAEDVALKAKDGLTLRGCYIKTPVTRRGVILFGLEFGSNRWACGPYTEHLVAAGYDVFAWEPRNQGDSDKQPDYEPLQWVTEAEADDARVALAYLKGRPDAAPRGVGLFGISKGGNAGLLVATEDPTIRCVLTDGAFPLFGVMVPYMRYWFSIYDKQRRLHGLCGDWVWKLNARLGVWRVQRQRKLHYPNMDRAARKLRQPWLAIHGQDDSYIKQDVVEAMVAGAKGPKELWVVPGAKHNLALTTVGDEYRRRTLEFFEKNLATLS